MMIQVSANDTFAQAGNYEHTAEHRVHQTPLASICCRFVVRYNKLHYYESTTRRTAQVHIKLKAYNKSAGNQSSGV